MEERPKVKRLDNIELLRIIAMLMVVTLHFIGRGMGGGGNIKAFSSTYFLVSFWDGVCIISVNVYVLISGYFLIDSHFKSRKLLNLVIQVLTYSLGFYLLFVLLKLVPFNMQELIKAAFPLLTYQYWFASAYVGMYLFFPFLNIGLKAMNEKQHRTLCFILFCLFTLYLPSKALVVNGYSIMWMISLYVFGSYLKLYYKPSGKVSWKLIIFYIIPTVLLPCTRFGIDFVGTILSRDLTVYSKFFYKNNSVFVCVSAIAFIMIFLNIKINGYILQRIIRTVAPLTFGVYLVHNNPTLRDTLWNLLHPYTYMNEGWFFFAGSGIICAIFIVSALIEYCRRAIYHAIPKSRIVKMCISRFGK